jgi:hypothetical protein
LSTIIFYFKNSKKYLIRVNYRLCSNPMKNTITAGICLDAENDVWGMATGIFTPSEEETRLQPSEPAKMEVIKVVDSNGEEVDLTPEIIRDAEGVLWDEVEAEVDEWDEDREPCEPDNWADGDALASAGFGTDEDYGGYGGDGDW